MDNTYAAMRDTTPSDSVDLPKKARALYTTTAGNVAFTAGGTSQALLAVPAFTCIPVKATRVLLTGTTAVVKALY
jgi:hypothetical protein